MGFIGVRSFLTPYKKVLAAPLSAAALLHNRLCNRLRWRVEDSFAQTKKFRFFHIAAPPG
eukprot:gene5806-10637_t